MKHFNFLNWSHTYLQACESFGVDPITGVDAFINCLSPLFYFTSSTDESNNIALKIFRICEKHTPKYVLDKATKKKHDNHNNKLQDFIVSDTNHDLDDYLVLITHWYNDVRATLPDLEINTSNGLKIEVSPDCSVFCDFWGLAPINVLQYYVDHVDCESVDKQKLLVTEFFIKKFAKENRPQ